MNKLEPPAKIDPANYARGSRQIEGSLEFTAMPRLVEALALEAGKVEYALDFTIDEEEFVVIGVKVEAVLPLICQRCMQPFEYEVKVYSSLSPVANEKQAKDLPDSYDAWPLSEEMTVSPKEIIEEELLLSLPIVPMHEEADCPAAILLESPKPTEQQATHKPFAILKKLK